MKKKHYIVLLHPIGEDVKTRIDFDSEVDETVVYELLKFEGYEIYQFILADYQYVRPIGELGEEGIRFEIFDRERKTWFGLSKKVEQELLIYPKDGFFYPYQYGSYFYLYSNKKIRASEFMKWMEEQFPERWADFDDALAGVNKNAINLINEAAYILITNHDYQKEFGLIASKERCIALTTKLKQAGFENFEVEEYVLNKE